MQLIGPMRCPMKPSWYLIKLRLSPDWLNMVMHWLTEPLKVMKVSKSQCQKFRTFLAE